MTLPSIGLFGYAGSGKDTVADYLVKQYAYTRVSFAAPLKEMALSIDHRVDCYGDERDIMLSDVVREKGWEYAKRNYPEVRRFLRSLGKTMRDQDTDYWLSIAMDKIWDLREQHMPAVVTDVRHENEYQHLWEDPHSFTMVRIDRPGTNTAKIDPESGALIASVTPDATITNDGSLESLRRIIDHIVHFGSDLPG